LTQADPADGQARTHALQLTIGDPDRRPHALDASPLQVWYAGGTGTAVARALEGHDQFLVEFPGAALFGFTPGAPVVSVWPEPGVTRDTIDDIFFRQLQPIVLQASGWQALHASAGVTAEGLLVFCGRAHAGKSTFAYALARRGFPQFTDDQLVWRPAGGSFETCPLPFVPRLRTASREYFADAAVDASITADPVPLSRIVLLDQQPGAPTSFTRVPGPRAFSDLLGYAHCFNPNDRAETARLVRDYSDLVARVPVFALTYAPGFAWFDDVIGRLLDPAAWPAT
jgi:hypothetical protein